MNTELYFSMEMRAGIHRGLKTYGRVKSSALIIGKLCAYHALFKSHLELLSGDSCTNYIIFY